MFTRGYRVGLTVVALMVGVTACSSSAKGSRASSATEPATVSTTTESTTDAVPRSGLITVTARDYGFEGVPPVVASGAKFTMHNASPSHIHEMVAVKIPATEHRSVTELSKLTHAELLKTLSPRPAFVLLQAPGAAQVIKGIGDGTVTEPGRYAMICSVQLNVTPDQYLRYLATHPGEAPEIPGGGAPHYSKGMYAEFTVK